MKNIHRISLSFLTALLLWASWPARGFAPLLFIALIPLLLVEEDTCRKKEKGIKTGFFLQGYFSMILFNLFTTWWIYYASPGGMVMAVMSNALIMAVVLQLFHVTKQKLGNTMGYLSLVVYWMSYEFFHYSWELSYPWLNFGNGFAAWCDMIQWYEYTGVLGGTLWVLLVNIMIVHYLKLYHIYRTTLFIKKIFIYAACMIFIPIGFSLIIKHNYKETSNPINVVVVQPNIDPYNEKFGGMSSFDQLNKIMRLAADETDEKTDYVVCPETALPDGIWENDLQDHPQIAAIRSFIKPFPNLNFITGLSSNRLYITSTPPNKTARKFRDSDNYYDTYNTGMQVENDTLLQLHHKSKLVLGVEKVPFSGFFGFFEKFAIGLGGATGSLGTQPVPSVFKSKKALIAPVICYESVYGEYIGEYVKQGAQAIFIITNDGWWHDTPGYLQHCQYGRLRAIESRRDIARSANTGTSCFIDQLGNISQATKWWVPAVIKQDIQLNDKLTFYTKHGDYLGQFSVVGSIILLLLTLIKWRSKSL